MARLTVQLGGSLVVPMEVPRRYPADWRTRAFDEARLAVLMEESADIVTTRRTMRAGGESEAAAQPKIQVGDCRESQTMDPVIDAARFRHWVKVGVCGANVPRIMQALARRLKVRAV